MYAFFRLLVIFSIILITKISYAKDYTYNFSGDTPQERIGVSYAASEQEINKQCRKLMFTYHPDRFTTAQEKTQADGIFKQVGKDCDKLKNKDDRFTYRTNESSSQDFEADSTSQSSDSSQGQGNSQNNDQSQDKFWDDFWKEFSEQQRKSEEEFRKRQQNYQHSYDNFFNYDYFSDDLSGSRRLENFNLYTPIYDMTLRRSYAPQRSSNCGFFGNVTAVPYALAEDWRAAGLIMDFVGGYEFLFGSITMNFGVNEGYIYNRGSTRFLTIAGLTEMLFTLGTMFGDRRHAQIASYILTGIPTVHSSAHDGIPDSSAFGNPFYTIGLGIDGSYNFLAGDRYDLIVLSNIRWIHYFSRNCDFGDKTPVLVKPGERGDFLIGLKSRLNWFTAEVGMNWRVTSTMKSTFMISHESVERSRFMPATSAAYIILGGEFNLFALQFGTSFGSQPNPTAAVWGALSFNF